MIRVISSQALFSLLYMKSTGNMKALKKVVLTIFTLLLFSGCGTVVVATRPGPPPPPWFYPNRLELVRYVYFPEFQLYYDLSDRVYLYLDGRNWIRVRTLPERYRSLNLNRSRYVRVRDYYDDNIAPYHEENNRTKGRSNVNTPPGHRNS